MEPIEAPLCLLWVFKCLPCFRIPSFIVDIFSFKPIQISFKPKMSQIVRLFPFFFMNSFEKLRKTLTTPSFWPGIFQNTPPGLQHFRNQKDAPVLSTLTRLLTPWSRQSLRFSGTMSLSTTKCTIPFSIDD